MFTDEANQMLNTFDAKTPPTARGALQGDSSTQTISLLPMTLSLVSFQTALAVMWYGAELTLMFPLLSKTAVRVKKRNNAKNVFLLDVSDDASV
jgi:hypothetical protein